MELSIHTIVGKYAADSCLGQLLNTIVSNYMSVANRNNTQLLNEVKQVIPLGATMQKAVEVVDELLATVVSNSRNGDIHITAERFKDVVIVEIQERNNYNGYALSSRIGSIAPDAEKLGGHITIKGPQQRVTTISFSFPNIAA